MWYTFDTETRGLFREIFAWRAYDGANLVGGRTGLEAVKWLENLTSDDHVYIHNLDFDLAKLIKSGLFIDLDECVIIARRFASARVIDGPMLHCSWHIMRSSLASLSKSFELGSEGKKDLEERLAEYGFKDKNDFFMHVKHDHPLLSEYLDYDVISLYKILAQVMEFSELGDKFFKIVSTPQLAMKVFQRNFKNDYKALIAQKIPTFTDDFIRSAYIGADTQMFRPHMIKRGFHYDINSLYPYVMETYEYPYGVPRYEEEEKAEDVFALCLKHPERYAAYIVEATVKMPKTEAYPCLPVHLDGKLMFPVGEFSGFWTKPELEYAISRGVKVLEIHRIMMWRHTKDYFSRFIAWAKAGKIESKGGKRQFYKDVMNSFYGKLGMSLIRLSYRKATDYNRELFIQDLPIYDYESEYAGSFFEGWIQIDPFKAPYVQPQIAAYVTAYARLELIRQIHAEVARGNIVYYCDTDSMAVEKALDDSIVDDTEFGKWKLESYIEEGIFLAPKLYAELHPEDKPTLKAKGVPKAFRDEQGFGWYLDTLNGLIDGEKRFRFYSGGKRRMKIISAMKQEKDLDREVPDEKVFNFSSRQKRDVNWAKNISRPWDAKVFYDEIQEYEEAKNAQGKRSEYKEVWMREHNGAPSLWWAVKKLGGVKKSSRYSVPRWMYRNKGITLDIMLDDLKSWGFYFETADDLAIALNDWQKHSYEL